MKQPHGVQILINDVAQAIEYYGPDFEYECEQELSENLKKERN